VKKLVSVALLLVFLFSVGGYYLVFMGLRYSIYADLSQRIDVHDFEPGETLEFKIPLTLPYPIYHDDYVRNHGEFEYNGEYYILAGQKLVNDTLYIKSVRNDKRKQLTETFKEFAQAASASGENDNRILLVKIIKDFKGTEELAHIHQPGWQCTFTFMKPSNTQLTGYTRPHFHPPDFLL
jgi:hypothetical protein